MTYLSVDATSTNLSTCVPISQNANPVASCNEQLRLVTYSPTSSPHKLGKDGPKRRRIVVVRKLTHHQQTYVASTLSSSPYRHRQLTSFQTSEVEQIQLDYFSDRLFHYILQKLWSQKKSLTIADVQSFIQPSVNVMSSSTICYMEIINENPDSEETRCTWQKTYLVL